MLMHYLPAPYPALAAPTQIRRRGAGLVFCLALLAGCINVPSLDDQITEADMEAAFPRLVPAEQIQQAAGTGAIQPETQSSLEDRVTALNRRADGLRGTGLDPQTRARMQAGVTLPAL